MPELFSVGQPWLPYVSAVVMGLLGGGHCIGMCGGISSALAFAVKEASAGRRLSILLAYNVGRIGSYALMGALMGVAGAQFISMGGLPVLRVVAGLLLIAMGLYVAGWWRGLTYLERMGSVLWRHIQPLGRRLMPVQNPASALLLGALWGWLPCGLVYSALAYSATQGEGVMSAGVMAAFGLGTLPAVLGSGLFADRLRALLQARGWRSAMGVLLVLFGVWTLWLVVQHAGHMSHSMPQSGEMPMNDPAHHHHH